MEYVFTLPGTLADQVGLTRLAPLARAPSVWLKLGTHDKASGLTYSTPQIAASEYLGQLGGVSAILPGSPHPRELVPCAEMFGWAPRAMISLVEVCSSTAFLKLATIGHLDLLRGVFFTLPGTLADQVGLTRLSPLARAPSVWLKLCTHDKASGLTYSTPLIAASVYLGQLCEVSAILPGSPRGQVGLAWFSLLARSTPTLARVEALASTLTQRLPGPQRGLVTLQESAGAGSSLDAFSSQQIGALGASSYPRTPGQLSARRLCSGVWRTLVSLFALAHECGTDSLWRSARSPSGGLPALHAWVTKWMRLACTLVRWALALVLQALNLLTLLCVPAYPYTPLSRSPLSGRVRCPMLLGGSTPSGGDRRSVYNPKRDRTRPRRRRQGQDSSASAASASSSNAGEGNAKYEAYVPPVRIRGAAGPAADLLEWLRQEAGFSYHYPHSLSAGQEDGLFIARFRSRKERGLFLTEFGAHVPKAPWKGIALAFEDDASDTKATAPRSSARSGRDRSRGVSFASPHSEVVERGSATGTSRWH